MTKTMTRTLWKAGSMALILTAFGAACGGGGGSNQPVSGTVASASGAAVRVKGILKGSHVRVTGLSGLTYDAEPNSRGRFALMLPDNDSYIMSFEHTDMTGTHSAGHLVFGCGSSETDRFPVSGGKSTIDLGRIKVRNDGGFARPKRNPLKQLDSDGDGIPDSRDPDTSCVDVGDSNNDGYYDDDMDHDGHHDDDADGDGYHDCEMSGMGHNDNDVGNCPGPGMTRTPARTPMSGPMHTPGVPIAR